MNGSRRYAALTAAPVIGLLLAPLAFPSVGSASSLRIDPGVAQTWLIRADHLQPQPPAVDLSACGPLEQYDEVVYVTAGPDSLVRGNGRQILVGLGGDDRLEAGNHDDCLIGGPGSDTLLGGNGKDVLVGGAGADLLDGQTGPDVLHGDAADSCVVAAPDAASGCRDRHDTASEDEDEDSVRAPESRNRDRAPGSPPSPQQSEKGDRSPDAPGGGEPPGDGDNESSIATPPGHPSPQGPSEPGHATGEENPSGSLEPAPDPGPESAS